MCFPATGPLGHCVPVSSPCLSPRHLSLPSLPVLSKDKMLRKWSVHFKHQVQSNTPCGLRTGRLNG